MNTETRKMLLRSIRATLGRFLAILAIVALGVGFYAGLKSSQPDMLRSADDYMRRQKMYDLQLMSSLGLMKSDPAAFQQLPGVDAAEGACFADAYARFGDGDEEVWHFQTLTEAVAVPELLLGRMPENSGECLGDSSVFRTEDLYHDERIDDATKKILSIQTYYESMWITRGLNIKYMKWHLPRTGKLEEPDVEIELDDYRSYHRSKRSSLDKAK